MNKIYANGNYFFVQLEGDNTPCSDAKGNVVVNISSDLSENLLSATLTVNTTSSGFGNVISTIELDGDFSSNIIANVTDFSFTYLNAALVEQKFTGKATSVVFIPIDDKTYITPDFQGFTPVTTSGSNMTYNQKLYTFELSYLISSPKIGQLNLPLSTLADENGIAYNQSTWEAFYLANSGFNPASGGSGAGDMTKSVYDTNDDGIVNSADKEMIQVINKTGSTITKGSIVYLKSTSSSGTHPEILLASASTEATSSKTLGAVYDDILTDELGYVVTSGEVRNAVTNTFNIGDKLWLSSTPGQVQTTPPLQPLHSVFIGTVTRSQTTNGRILYAIQNGYEIGELHDVLLTNPINNDVLVREDGLWKNKPSSTIGASLVREQFTWTSGAQTFTLASNISQVYSVEVQGQGALHTSQYTIGANSITITDTLDANDYIVVIYSANNGGVNPSYTQAQSDALFLGKPNKFVYVSTKNNLPSAIAGVITLEANTTYYFTDVVDLTGDRLVAGINTTILGASSENCRIKSTGLTASALISSNYSLPLRNITLEANIALNLDGDTTTTALDWFGVNFTDCNTIGTIRDYTNFVMSDSAFLNSQGLTFDGTIGTIGISNCLFDIKSSGTAFILPSTLNVTRRFRVIYSSFVVLSGETGLNVSTSATIGDEKYILDTVNFSGGGTYLTGVTHTNNKALFINCVNITNTATRGFYYMVNNATDTTIGIPNTNVWVKAGGTTTENSGNSKFTHTSNRLTYTGAFSNSFQINVNANVRTGSPTQVISIGIAKNGTILAESEMTIRTDIANQEYPGSTSCQLEMITNDYFEVFVKNTSSTNVRVSDLNVSCIKIPV